jgi:hypothetical protein
MQRPSKVPDTSEMHPMNIGVSIDEINNSTSSNTSTTGCLPWCYNKLGCHKDRPNTGSVHDQLSWEEERLRRVPPRTCTAAILLLLGGIIFVSIGLSVFYSGDMSTGTNLLVIGGLMFLPGSYASWILYGAYVRWPGYEFHQVPSYDE